MVPQGFPLWMIVIEKHSTIIGLVIGWREVKGEEGMVSFKPVIVNDRREGNFLVENACVWDGNDATWFTSDKEFIENILQERKMGCF